MKREKEQSKGRRKEKGRESKRKIERHSNAFNSK
jgi:hypothetical protein